MRIVLSSIDDPLAQAWQTYCGDLPGVEIHQGNILNAKVDAVVSPANSFGFMDGGIDLVYSQHFGWNVQKQLQDQTRNSITVNCWLEALTLSKLCIPTFRT